MKKTFLEPELELIRLSVADVVATSLYIPEEDELPFVPAVPQLSWDD